MRSVHQKDAQNGGVCDLCIKKMHRMEGYAICASKRCTEWEGMRSVHKKDAQNGRVQDLCIKKMHRMEGYAICA
jgi:ribosomal protein S15P/S13E